MAENLLSFSDIELFGVTLSGLDVIAQEEQTIKVAAVLENAVTSLNGRQLAGHEKFAPDDLVLVMGQSGNVGNGVYKVMGPGEDWQLVPVDTDNFISQIKRQRPGGGDRTLWRVESRTFHPFKQATIRLSVSKINDAQPATLKQFKVNGIDIIGGEVDLEDRDAETCARMIAAEINRHVASKFSATVDDNVITISAPAHQGHSANGWTFTRDSTNLRFNSVSGTSFAGGETQVAKFIVVSGRNPGQRRRGSNRQLQDQLNAEARFARIYGFTYEGAYYDIPRPTLFLVHGEGELVTEQESEDGSANRARAPRSTALTGLASAGFDFADDLRVWSYDQADYTIRMDVETGMFERVLLEAMLDPESERIPNARGMHARGMHARGMHARGMHARGMHARGGNSD